jgi:hypothetical protein
MCSRAAVASISAPSDSNSILQDLKFMDSMDKDKSFGIWSYIDLPDPAKGEEGFPRLLIENRAYRSRVFRKLHMELAHRQDGLQACNPDKAF